MNKDNINIEDHEFPDDLSTTIGRTDHLQICTEPNDIKGLSYFKVYDKEDSTRYCRISMTEPEILNFEDENLKLTKEGVAELIEFFAQETKDYQGKPLGINNWEYLIEDSNFEADSKDSEFYIDENLPIPDYTKLI